MSPNKPLRYRLSPKALEDLDDIWRYTAEKWSLDQADSYIDELASAFALISSMPLASPQRTEFDPPVRIHVHHSHLIIYEISQGHINIVRILGGRQNWQAILKNLE